MKRHAIWIVISLLIAPVLFSQPPASKRRQIRGTAQIVIGLIESPNVANAFDNVRKDTVFTYLVTFLPPREQVQSDFVFDATTQNGRSLKVRLVQPGSGIADFNARRIELDLVFEVTLQNKKFQVPIHWTTGHISDALGSEEGKVDNVNLQTESADIKLVGTSRFSAKAKDFNPGTAEDKDLNFVIRLIMEGHLSDAP